MTALILLIGLLTPPPADAIDEWKRAGSENLENTRWWTDGSDLGWEPAELRKIWYLQAIGDLETYSKKARAWRARYPEKKP